MLLIPAILAYLVALAAAAPGLFGGGGTPGQTHIWGPTSVFYWRCSTPKTSEVSWDLKNWKLSSTCLGDTCCSPYADSPSCTAKACDLGFPDGGEAAQGEKSDQELVDEVLNS